MRITRGKRVKRLLWDFQPTMSVWWTVRSLVGKYASSWLQYAILNRNLRSDMLLKDTLILLSFLLAKFKVELKANTVQYNIYFRCYSSGQPQISTRGRNRISKLSHSPDPVLWTSCYWCPRHYTDARLQGASTPAPRLLLWRCISGSIRVISLFTVMNQDVIMQVLELVI